MVGASSAYEREERCVQGFGGETYGKETLRRSVRKWEGNIKADLQELRWGGIGCIYLVQVRDKWRMLVNAVLNLRFSLKFGEFFDYLTSC